MALEYVTTDPPNAGVPLDRLDGRVLDQSGMFVRSNFPLPEAVAGIVEVVMPGSPTRSFSVTDLDGHDRVERPVMFECAGNGRTLMRPVPEGTPWTLGGASHVVVAGVRLAGVLAAHGGVPDEVVDVVFTGADRGIPDDPSWGSVPYQFSLTRGEAVSPVPLLVTHIGGEPLTHEHGAPLRLLVPGHYGMKSVKWLTRIEGVTEPFAGYFVERYRFYGDDAGRADRHAVGPIQVRSIIATPADGDAVTAGDLTVVGSAWSGAGAIAEVGVSVDDADPVLAELEPAGDTTLWRATVPVVEGRRVIAARATDVTGASQPLEPVWNANGFANNVVHRVAVDVANA